MKKSALMLCMLLSACGDSNVQEVRQWMKEVDSQTRPSVKPLQEPKTFVPFAYASAEAADPFSPNKLLAELARARGGGGLQPDTGRRKEFLESFPLDTMKMVGTLQKGGAFFALLQVDRSVYQVRAGQYLGQNFGQITSISEEAVNVKEVVQDAAGDWVERMSKLELQDSKESTQ
jgi:type IV pilus assembly protein PilP